MSREIDVKVAEMMGWGGLWTDGANYLMYPPHEQKLGVGYDERCVIPYYSTDIAAAMEIVEELKKSFYSVSINIYQDCCSVIVWDDDISVAASHEGKELPQTIALAALKAKGISVEGWGSESQRL